jgi:hypothetical protein
MTIPACKISHGHAIRIIQRNATATLKTIFLILSTNWRARQDLNLDHRESVSALLPFYPALSAPIEGFASGLLCIGVST